MTRSLTPRHFTIPLTIAASLVMAPRAAYGEAKDMPGMKTMPQAEHSESAMPAMPMSDMSTMPAAPMMGASMASPGVVMQSLGPTFLGRILRASRITVSGWFDISATASSAQHDNTPLSFNYRANEFLLQQAWLRIDRPVDRKGTEVSWGFRSDWLFGSDYRYTLARGIFNSQLTTDHGKPATYGVDPIQFYVEAYFPRFLRGLEVKLGRFSMIHGVEMNEAPMNLLASHNYDYPADPFTHTGLLATAHLTGQWTLQAGITTGSDVFLGPAAAVTFIGGLRWIGANQRTSLACFAIVGPGRYNQAENFDNRQLFDVVLFRQFTRKLTYLAEGAFGFQDGVPDIGTAIWYGLVQYVTYAFTNKLRGTFRLEFFNDVAGQRTGFSGLYTGITAGVGYRPTHGLVFRPEVRFDTQNRALPFENKPSLFTATLDAIARF